jgi:MoaA/NifB/PqqE/SkfB family radical SAM enzyme
MKIDKIEQINFEMAGNCNIKCPMCPQSSGREEDFLKKFPIELFKKAINEAIPLGLKYIQLSGSGEPLLSKDLEEAVSYASERGLITLIYTNGVLLNERRYRKLNEAGLSILKVSCMGWDRESFKHWMSVDNFDKVRNNLKKCLKIKKHEKLGTYLQTNHLIHDYENIELEKKMYIDNWINYLGIDGEIWIEHNWAGLYSNTDRSKLFEERKIRSCGRPLANVVEIRSGGIGDEYGAVVPCPNVLGQDSKAVMGHLSKQSLIEIVNGELMQSLRKAHLENSYEEFDYCQNCDQLLEVEEALVWTNVPDRKYGESRVSKIRLLDN